MLGISGTSSSRIGVSHRRPTEVILNRKRTADGGSRHIHADEYGLGDYNAFLDALGQVAAGSKLTPRLFCPGNVMDIRKGSVFYPLHQDASNAVLRSRCNRVGSTGRLQRHAPLGYPYKFIINNGRVSADAEARYGRWRPGSVTSAAHLRPIPEARTGAYRRRQHRKAYATTRRRARTYRWPLVGIAQGRERFIYFAGRHVGFLSRRYTGLGGARRDRYVRINHLNQTPRYAAIFGPSCWGMRRFRRLVTESRWFRRRGP